MFKFTVSTAPVEYPDAVNYMQKKIQAIKNGECEEIWFLEHPPIFTLGSSANKNDILSEKFPIYSTQRGGKVTYHGPGQLIAYVMIDLKKRNNDPRAYVKALENWMIATLKEFNIHCVTKLGRIGVWVEGGNIECKIAALGVRVTHGITWHGVSLNVNTDLSHYDSIIPCGLKEFSITSMRNEGCNTNISSVIEIMKKKAEYYLSLQP